MRKKKYIEIKNMSELNIDISETLQKDYITTKELVKHKYTVTTSGGSNILWEVNEKDGTSYNTVSTKAIKYQKVNRHITVPVYEHYVLTDAGLQYCKELVMMESF
jgi:hypothetical protein